MNINKMMVLAIPFLFFNLQAFASPVRSNLFSLNCQSFDLFPEKGVVSVTLSKQSGLDSDEPFRISLFRPGNVTTELPTVEGLKAEVIKSVQIDQLTRRERPMGLPTRTEITVYGVKFLISAEENITHQLAGCIMRPVKELELYTICFEHESVPSLPR